MQQRSKFGGRRSNFGDLVTGGERPSECAMPVGYVPRQTHECYAAVLVRRHRRGGPPAGRQGERLRRRA